MFFLFFYIIIVIDYYTCTSNYESSLLATSKPLPAVANRVIHIRSLGRASNKNARFHEYQTNYLISLTDHTIRVKKENLFDLPIRQWSLKRLDTLLLHITNLRIPLKLQSSTALRVRRNTEPMKGYFPNKQTKTKKNGNSNTQKFKPKTRSEFSMKFPCHSVNNTSNQNLRSFPIKTNQ